MNTKLMSGEDVAKAAFVRCFLEHVDPLRLDGLEERHQPLSVVLAAEAKSPSKYLKAVTELCGEILAISQNWDGKRLADCDTELSSAGAPTLRQMRLQASGVLKRLIVRGSAANLDEYSLAQNAVSDLAGVLSVDQLSALDAIVARYEAHR